MARVRIKCFAITKLGKKIDKHLYHTFKVLSIKYIY